MPDGQQMQNVILRLECIDDTIIADAEAVAIAASQTVMRKRIKAQAHFVYFGLNSALDIDGEFAELAVKRGVVNLSGRAHKER
jgi:hypothetical protein